MFITNADVTRIDPTALFNPGDWTEIGTKRYVYVKYHYGDGSVTATAGHIGYLCGTGTETADAFTVTEDHDATTKVNTSYALAFGMFESALTNGTYGWVQVKGFNDQIMLSDDSVDDGEQVTPGDADGTIKGIAAGTATSPLIGYAVAADGGTAPAKGSIFLCFF